MPTTVVLGATCRCMYGSGEGQLIVSDNNPSVGGKRIATLTDIQINPAGAPFITCCALNNPTMMAVGSPGPCTFVPAGTWQCSGNVTKVGGKPVLNTSATLSCASFGGTVIISNPGQQTAQSK